MNPDFLKSQKFMKKLSKPQREISEAEFLRAERSERLLEQTENNSDGEEKTNK